MGPYCEFCDHRCFVERYIPGRDGQPAQVLLMATCPQGAEHDFAATGFDHSTALNTSAPAVRLLLGDLARARTVAVTLEQALARLTAAALALLTAYRDGAVVTDLEALWTELQDAAS